MSQLCAFVCLSVLLAAVSAQTNPTRRPLVQARPVEGEEMDEIMRECAARAAINDTITNYVRVPSDCAAFAVCGPAGANPVLNLCPAGLFFNDDMDVLTCVHPRNSGCPERGDPCVGRPDGFNQDVVRTQTLQGAYYVCEDGRARGGGWCDFGQQYLRFDQACMTIPDRVFVPPAPSTPVPCHLQSVEGNAKAFVIGDATIECPGWTNFNGAMCRCD